VLYRYIHADVWFQESHCHAIWFHLNKVPKKWQTYHVVGSMDVMRSKMVPLVKVIIKLILVGGEDGAEIANYYERHAHPVTGKKIAAVRS
jgi:hypothetical protein